MSTVYDLQSIESVQQLFHDSLAVLFKHSTRCPISMWAKVEFDTFAASYESEGKLYYLDVITYRDISNEIADKTGVAHQSPQVLVLKNGNVIWHASHWNITERASMTKSPPTRASKISCLVITAMVPRNAPRESEPTSPMNIWAG